MSNLEQAARNEPVVWAAMNNKGEFATLHPSREDALACWKLCDPVALYRHPAPPPAAQSPQNLAQADIDAARERVKALEAERDTLREQLEAEQRCVTQMQSAARGDRSEPHDARVECVRELWDAWARLASVLAVRDALAAQVKPTPAPTQGEPARPQFTAEDRAWMDAMQAECAERPWNLGNIRELSRSAIAARGGKGVADGR